MSGNNAKRPFSYHPLLDVAYIFCALPSAPHKTSAVLFSNMNRFHFFLPSLFIFSSPSVWVSSGISMLKTYFCRFGYGRSRYDKKLVLDLSFLCYLPKKHKKLPILTDSLIGKIVIISWLVLDRENEKGAISKIYSSLSIWTQI